MRPRRRRRRTSGLYDDATLARLVDWAPLFGQINVSVDGSRAGYEAVRGFDGLAQAERALVALRDKKREIGINCVVTRQNFDELGGVFAHITVMSSGRHAAKQHLS